MQIGLITPYACDVCEIASPPAEEHCMIKLTQPLFGKNGAVRKVADCVSGV